jgi:hypothetical protein
MQFNLFQVRVNEYYRMYEDLTGALAGALSDLGHSVTVTTERFEPDAVNVFLGSTVFAAQHSRLAEILAGKPYVAYQLEQLDERLGLLPECPEYWTLLKNASAVWDYSPLGVAFLEDKGLKNIAYLPPGYHSSLERFRPEEEPDIDVLFAGSPHPRRETLLSGLKAQGLKVVYLQHSFGPDLDRHIARAKIVLNMHAWEGLQALETVRLSYLLANRSFVISEESDHNPYGDGVVYAPYDNLVETCRHFARQPADVRDRVAENGYRAIRRIEMADVLRKILQTSDFERRSELT